MGDTPNAFFGGAIPLMPIKEIQARSMEIWVLERALRGH
jgi:hypothetical protein